MKPVLQAVLFLGPVTPSFSAAPVVDFDGKNGAKLNTSILLRENTPNIQAPLKITEGDSRGVRMLMWLNENGEFAAVKPNKSWIDETGGRANEYLVRPDVPYYWSIHCNTNSQPTWTAKGTYSFTFGAGGHYHYNPPAPPLKATDVSTTLAVPPASSFKTKPSPMLFPTMSVNREYYYWEWMPLFSTQIVEYLEWYGACSGMQTDYLYVIQSTSLVKMSEGVGYEFVGETPEHPENHYVSLGMKSKLTTIGKEWDEACHNSATLKYNDMSLVWGGLFDLNNNWTTPHTTHRFGNNADVSKKWVKKGNREKLIRLMCKHVRVQSEGNVIPEKEPHFHLTLKTSKIAEDFDEKIIDCCPTAENSIIPAECIKLQGNGANYPEELPVETDCP